MATTKIEKVRGWDEKQVKTFVLDAIKGSRSLWDVAPSARIGIIAAKFAAVVTGQHADMIATAKLDNLWADMCAQARAWGLPE